ncbi:hypothetical protein [Gimesia sp.]|uniref:hypothetical protein n=1 Tax=Gimesia sp. TaxID=2024833 RepID=UPI003A8F5389
MSFHSRSIFSLFFVFLIPCTVHAGDINGRVPFHRLTQESWLGGANIGRAAEIDKPLELFEEPTPPPQRDNDPDENLNRVLMILAKADADRGKNGKSDLEVAQEEFEERVKAAMKSLEELFEKEKAIAIKRGNTHAADLIDRQWKRFKEKRILPSVIRTTHFEKEMVVAVTAIQKAYQSEIADCRRDGNQAKASLLETKAYNQISPYVFDGRRSYIREGGAVYAIQPDHSWLEVKNKGKSHVYFYEAARKSDYIELKSRTTDIRVRLYHDRVSLKDGYYPWRHFKNGRWAQ